jgi:hypothetical protein
MALGDLMTEAMARGDLMSLPYVYCLVCGRQCVRTGPSETTCSEGHRVAVWDVYTGPPAPAALPPAASLPGESAPAAADEDSWMKRERFL